MMSEKKSSSKNSIRTHTATRNVNERKRYSNVLPIRNFAVITRWKASYTILNAKVVGVEPVKNKQDKIYGIRFSYERQTFKASEIRREFGYHTIAKNFSPSPEQSQVQRQSQNNHYQSSFPVSAGVVSLLADLLTPNVHSSVDEEDNKLETQKEES